MSGFSERWRSVFGDVDPARTTADVEFLRRVLPQPEVRRVLDVPCGNGRHLHALVRLGYDVTGVDNDSALEPPVLGDPGGRLVFDLQNRAFFASRSPAERELRPGIVERSTLVAGRRRCEIDYGDGRLDVHEWQLYRPEELVDLGAAHGLEPLLVEASPDEATMRLVLRREGG